MSLVTRPSSLTEINTVQLDAAKGTEGRVGGTAQEQVPDGIGKLLALGIAAQSDGREVDGTAHAEDDQLAGGLAGLDGGDERGAVLEVGGTGSPLGGRGTAEGAQGELGVATAGEEAAEEGQVDNIVRRVGADVGESGAVVLGTPVDDQLASGGTLLHGGCGIRSSGQEAGSSQCFAEEHG